MVLGHQRDIGYASSWMTALVHSDRMLPPPQAALPDGPARKLTGNSNRQSESDV
jgi:hypothetical protein